MLPERSAPLRVPVLLALLRPEPELPLGQPELPSWAAVPELHRVRAPVLPQDLGQARVPGQAPEQAPELCEKLSGVYTLMYTRLITALRERSATIVEEVIGLLEYERETAELLVKKLAQENAASAAADTAPPAAHGTGTAGRPNTAQGRTP